MSNLYIIGNGFDMAHKLDTSYWSFRKFLEENHPEFLSGFESLYNIKTLDDTEPWYTKEAQERWNNKIYDELWSEFENTMGYPDTTGMLDSSTSVLDDMDLDGGNIGILDTMNQYWRDEFGFIDKLQMYVKEWIENVNTDNIKPIRKSLIDANDDLYLSFNYTDTLENVYKIDDVVHIHGGVEKVTDIAPVMGHCNQNEIFRHRNWAKEADEEFDEGETSIQNAIADYLEEIYKDTKSFIYDNMHFFKNLDKVDAVIIIGWSAGEVDLPYLKTVKEHIHNKTKWYAYWYDDKALKSLQDAFAKLQITGNYEVKYLQSDEFWNDVQI